jgi:hypothetical protein
MKSLRWISSLNLISLGLILLLLPACETNQESIKTTSVKPFNKPNRTPRIREQEKSVNIPVVKPDGAINKPDTVETHDRLPQKKSEIKMVRKVLNFHKKPLIT